MRNQQRNVRRCHGTQEGNLTLAEFFALSSLYFWAFRSCVRYSACCSSRRRDRLESFGTAAKAGVLSRVMGFSDEARPSLAASRPEGSSYERYSLTCSLLVPWALIAIAACTCGTGRGLTAGTGSTGRGWGAGGGGAFARLRDEEPRAVPTVLRNRWQAARIRALLSCKSHG